MRRSFLPGLVALCGALPSACVYRLPAPYLLPSPKLHLSIAAPDPGKYSVRVLGADSGDYSVPPDGRVTFDPPSLPRTCRVYLFGIPLKSGSQPETKKSIHVIEGGRTIAKLSLRDIFALPSDASGYQVLTLKK